MLLNSESKPDMVQVANVLNNIGEAYRAQKQFDKALPYLIEAKAKISEDAVGYASIMNNLGMVYEGLGQDKVAEESYLKAIEIVDKSSFHTYNTALESMYNLCLLYGNQKRIDEVSKLLERAVPLSKKVFGETHPKTKNFEGIQNRVLRYQQQSGLFEEWTIEMKAGIAANQNQDYSLAIPHLEKALSVIEKIAPESESLAATLLNLGGAYLYNEDYVKAEKVFTRALPLFQKYEAQAPGSVEKIQHAIRLAQAGQRWQNEQQSQKK